MTIAVLTETGFLALLAVVLAWAGAANIRCPEPAWPLALAALGAARDGWAGPRVLAAAELGIAVLVLSHPGACLPGVLLAGLFTCLALASGLLAAPGPTMGAAAVSGMNGSDRRAAHTLANLAAVVGAGVVALRSPASLAESAPNRARRRGPRAAPWRAPEP